MDLGSGIGQIVIQVAATVGCKSCGIEMIVERHQHALRLMKAFTEVLEEAGVEGVDHFVNSVAFINDTISNQDTEIAKCNHIFFNNFGPWFDNSKGDGTKAVNHIFQESMIPFVELGTQIITMTALPEASKRLHVVKFEIAEKSTTWNRNRLSGFHYTRVKLGWLCKKCSFENEYIAETCGVCNTVPPPIRL